MPLLISYGVGLFSPPPKPEQFFGVPSTQTSRILAGKLGTQTFEALDQATRYRVETAREIAKKQSDAYFHAGGPSRLFLALASVPLGYAAILCAVLWVPSAVGSGLIVGGALSVANGYWCYWPHAEDWLRLLSLSLAFSVLLFVGIRQTTRTAKNSIDTPS
ncbi:MAG: hypothetical protein IT563_07845 [Alphaproteobacteria bacterium]|nr:hypothetical protein [Alphaproteobacteria bacterium]